MTKIWTELRYGTEKNSIRLAKSADPEVITAFRDRALEQARKDARESRGLDPIIHSEDKAELTRLQRLFSLISPPAEACR